MKADQVRQWLMKHPRPAVVRVTDEHGGIQDVVCGQSTWTKVAETIAAMRPELVNALNTNKEVLRALRPEDMSEDWTPDDEEEDQAPQRATGSTPPQMEIPFERLDGESARFALFARLISDAYKHSNETAFKALSDIVTNLSRNAVNVDRSREQLYKAHVRQLEEALKQAGAEVPEQPNDMMQAMLGGLLQGMMAGGGGHGANGKGAA